MSLFDESWAGCSGQQVGAGSEYPTWRSSTLKLPARASLGRRSAVGACAAVAAALLALTCIRSANALTSVTLPGTPLMVSVGSEGQCQSSYAGYGNNYYPSSGTLGDCGLFLLFPTVGNPEGVGGLVYGFQPTTSSGFVPLEQDSQSPVSGSGTIVDPYRETTVFSVLNLVEDLAALRVTETTSYVNGESRFVAKYRLTNTSTSTLRFRAVYAGDLFSGGSGVGTGLYTEAAQRFIGGFSRVTGAMGGLEESLEAPRWSASQEMDADQMWKQVKESFDSEQTFHDTLEPLEINDAVGAEWDQYLGTGLSSGASIDLAINNSARVPSELVVTPTSQSLPTGSTAHVTFAATDLVGEPYAGATLHYTVTGPNAQVGRLTLDASGQAQLSYPGVSSGQDTVAAFVDLAGDGAQATGDPTGLATVAFQNATPREPGPEEPKTFTKGDGNGGSKARAADSFKMYLRGVASHRRTLRLTRVVVIGMHRGETAYLECRHCSGHTTRERIVAHGEQVRFSPKDLVVTRRSSLIVDVLADGLYGRYKVYKVSLDAGSATVWRQGCLQRGSLRQAACPS